MQPLAGHPMPFKPTAPLFKASSSSSQWLSRQYKDPYVRARLSNPANYRSRSAFKLLEVEARHGFLGEFLREAQESNGGQDGTENVRRRRLRRTFNIVDLGAAPGGWSQVIAAKLGLLEEEPQAPPSLPKPTTKLGRRNPKELKTRSKKRDKGSREPAELVDVELEDMEKYLDGNGALDWSAPSTRSSSSHVALKVASKEAGFDSMDPLDYLNGRDLDSVPSSAAESNVTLDNIPVNIIALDILPMRPVPGVHTLQMDFLAPQAADAVIALLAKLNSRRVGESSDALSSQNEIDNESCACFEYVMHASHSHIS